MGNFQLKWDQFVDVFIAQGAYEKVLDCGYFDCHRPGCAEV